MAALLKGELIASKVYDSAKPVKLRFDLTNAGDEDLYVLKWYTPLEGLNSDCLKVIRNEKTKVAYDGPMVKRGNPGPDDYVLVPAGGTVSADVNVSESYAVSLPADYRVELNIKGLMQVPAPGATKEGATLALAKSPPVIQELSGDQVKFKVKKGAVQLPTRGKTARKTSRSLAKSPKRPESSVRGSGVAATLLPQPSPAARSRSNRQSKQPHGDGFQLCKAASLGSPTTPIPRVRPGSISRGRKPVCRFALRHRRRSAQAAPARA